MQFDDLPPHVLAAVIAFADAELSFDFARHDRSFDREFEEQFERTVASVHRAVEDYRARRIDDTVLCATLTEPSRMLLAATRDVANPGS